MSEAITRAAKYIFLDVVQFSKGRSVEAQTDIVETLNSLVREAVQSAVQSVEEVIFLPTGDGLCIVLLDPATPYNLHLTIALDILDRLHKYNSALIDTPAGKMRKFDVRIGINENVDNVVTDINGRRNVAGAGINYAQRIMSCADGKQILVGQTVYDTLRHRERYLNSFRPFPAEAKHGVTFNVYQFIDRGYAGLDTNTPSLFFRSEEVESRFTLLEAYFIAYALRNEASFLSHAGHKSLDALLVLLWFLAKDRAECINLNAFDRYSRRVYRVGKATLEEQFLYYQSLDFYVTSTLAEFIRAKLKNCAPYFAESYPLKGCIFVNQRGRQKLQSEYPEIWKEFDLDTVNS